MSNKVISRKERHWREKGKGREGLTLSIELTDTPDIYLEEVISCSKEPGATKCQATGGSGR